MTQTGFSGTKTGSYLPRQVRKFGFLPSDDPLAELPMLRDAALGFVSQNKIAPYSFLNATTCRNDVLKRAKQSFLKVGNQRPILCLFSIFLKNQFVEFIPKIICHPSYTNKILLRQSVVIQFAKTWSQKHDKFSASFTDQEVN